MKHPLIVPIAGLLVLALAGWGLRAVFQTQHVATPPDSTTTIVTSVDTRTRFRQPLATAAQALILTCLAEIPSDLVGDVERLEDSDDFRVMVRPALDADESDKIRGCLNDFVVPSVLGGVVSLEHTGRDT